MTAARAGRHCPCSWPKPRAGRGAEGPPRLDEFVAGESLATATAIGDADAEVGRFSGAPDSIVLQARANGAIFTLRTRDSTSGRIIVVQSGETIETHLRAEVVLARNLTAGMNAVVAVHGKWAARELAPETAAPPSS
jgi:hypothetical protein